jgi:cytochrome P450
MTDALPPKASRNYSKRSTALNVIAAWIAIAASMWAGREMAAIIAPLMVMLIAALLGVYQTIGHFDLRALAALSGRPTPPPQPSPPQAGEGES